MIKKTFTRLFVFIIALSTMVVLGQSNTVTAAGKKGEGVYPLYKCIVSGESLSSMGSPVVYNHEGREIRFCCKGCINTFNKKPAYYLSKIDEEIVKQQLPYYPLDTCIVSGKKLASMSKPINKVYNNRLVRFCCNGCVSKFNKDPEKFLAQLDKAIIAKQLASYPLDRCVVSGMKLDSMGEPVNYIFANRLVRFCCSGCINTFLQNPAKYMLKLR